LTVTDAAAGAVVTATAGWTSDAALPATFCALALEPTASMKKPMTAAAARPPRSFTTIIFAYVGGRKTRWRRFKERS
jgi:hypothetical protein